EKTLADYGLSSKCTGLFLSGIAAFNTPTGVAVDSAGNVYVADWSNHTIRKVTPTGAVTTLAGTAGVLGSADAAGAAASFHSPPGVAVYSADNVYVADQLNCTTPRLSSAREVTPAACGPGVIGSALVPGAAARFHSPTGVAVDSAGNVYVADELNFTIRKV